VAPGPRRTALSALGCLAAWLGLLLTGAALFVFILAAIQLLALLPGYHGRSDTRFFPTGWALGLGVGIPLLLDLAVRLAGRRRVAAVVPVQHGDQLARDARSFGTRPVPPGLQELAFVPILLLIPVLVLGGSGAHGWRTGAAVFVGLAVAVAPLFAGLFGGPLFAVAGLLAWLSWAGLTLHGDVGPANGIGLGLAAAVWTALYAYFRRADRQLRKAPGDRP